MGVKAWTKQYLEWAHAKVSFEQAGEIQWLKSEISVERLVESFGVKLKRHWANLVGRCPFHDDGMPSLNVTPKTKLWSCKGACNVDGPTIDWVMKTQGLASALPSSC